MGEKSGTNREGDNDTFSRVGYTLVLRMYGWVMKPGAHRCFFYPRVATRKKGA